MDKAAGPRSAACDCEAGRGLCDGELPSAGGYSPGGLATDGGGGFAIVGAFTGELATDAGTLRAEGTDGFVTRWAQ